MMKHHSFLIGFALLLTACGAAPVTELLPSETGSTPTSSVDADVQADNTIELLSPENKAAVVTVEHARTPEEQMRGLMGRTVLPEGTGMLFTFESEQQLSFWMKNTLIPLDIVYFDAEGNFVSAATMEPCTQDPCRTYLSATFALYALELPAGTVADWGIKTGWRLKL